MDDKTPPSKEPKPGSAYFKLKKDLRTLITLKRKDDLEKKRASLLESENERNKSSNNSELDDEEEELEELNRESQNKNKKEILVSFNLNSIDLFSYTFYLMLS